MRFVLKTSIKRPFSEVSNDFDKELFEYLAPPTSIASIERYDGSQPGDEISLLFRFPKARWLSRIEDRDESNTTLRFTDRGIELPFPIATWHHIHTLNQTKEGTQIIDEMHFTSRLWLLSPFLYVAIVLGFFPRKWQYKRYFEHENSRNRSGVGRNASREHTR